MDNKYFDKFKLWFIIVAVLFIVFIAFRNAGKELTKETIKIISSTDNQDLERLIVDYGNKNDVNVVVEYAGTLEIMDKLNSGEKYDAVWVSNSMWLYMLDNVKTSDSKIVNMNPVVFGIRKDKAVELGFVDKSVKLEDIITAIRDGKLKFAMTSATQTNTGACAYLGFLSVLAGNPEILTEEYLKDENIKKELITLFSGVDRSSGSEDFLEEMYLNGDCDAILTYETSIININKNIKDDNDVLYAIYTEDGVSMSDSVFAYLGDANTPKEEAFLKLQSYLLSDEAQQELMKKGRRVWYGGVKEDVDKTIFNPDWGIDTTKYITPIKFPSTNIIKQALSLYQSELRKPTHILFALDYSGSMSNEGVRQLTSAMNYILKVDEASKNFLQFSDKDKISFIFFNRDVSDIITIENGTQTQGVLDTINKKVPSGGTNIYDSVTKAIAYLNNVDKETYNVSIVLMTDGEGTTGDKNAMIKTIKSVEENIPVYSIMFGNASDVQLEEIANLTSGKVFDGRSDLLNAFKTVRGYN